MNNTALSSIIKTAIAELNILQRLTFFLSTTLFFFPFIAGETTKQELVNVSLIIPKYIFINYDIATSLITGLIFFQVILIFTIWSIPFLAKKVCQCEFGENYEKIIVWQKLLAQFFSFLVKATLILIVYYKICYYNLHQSPIINGYIDIIFIGQVVAYIKKQYELAYLLRNINQ